MEILKMEKGSTGLFFRYFCLTCLFFSSFTNTCYTNLYQNIAKENLKSLSTISNQKQTPYDPNQKLEARFKAYFDKLIHPDPKVRRQSMLTLLSQFEEKNPLPQTDTLDQKTWIDLEILCGPKSNTGWYLASQLDRTVTEAGKAALFRKLINPQHDIKQIEKQQAIVAHLINNKSLFNKLDEKLKALVESENLMLSYWYDENFRHNNDDKIRVLFSSKIACLKKLENKINKSPLLWQINNINNSAVGLAWKGYSFYLCLAGLIYTVTKFDLATCLPEKIYKSAMIPKMKQMSKFMTLPIWGIPLLKMISNKNKRKKIEDTSKKGYNLLNKSKQIYRTVQNLSGESYSHWNDLRKKDDYAKVIHVARYINNLKAIAKLVTKNDELAARMPSIKNFNEYLAKLEQTSKDMSDLLKLFEKKTFDGNYSSRFMYWGRVKIAFDLIANLKDQFVDAMITIGEIDAQLSIAKLYKEFQDKRVTFCFPTYIDQATVNSPSVKAIDFWNPSIDSKKVIPNSSVLKE